MASSCAIAFGGGVLITLMIGSMLIDWMFPFADSLLRIVLTGATLLAAILTVAWMGWNPIRRALGWKNAASSVDQGIPELEQRWSTVASLSSTDTSTLSPIARAMAAQVTSEAIAMEKVVQPRFAHSPLSIRPAISVLSASSLVLAVLLLVHPQQWTVLLNRFWSPSSQITATQLVSETGNQLVPRGESVQLVTRLSGMQRSRGALTMIDSLGNRQEFQLRPDDTDTSQFMHLMRVDESFAYRVRSGDGQTDWHQIKAIDFPELEAIRFKVDFPRYTNRPSVERDRIPKRMKVIQGSTLQVALKPVEPLKQLSISITTPEHELRSSEPENVQNRSRQDVLFADDEGWYHFRMQLLEDVIIRPELISIHGLENQRRLFSRIDVISDKAPVARVVSPTDEMAVSLDEVIEIEFEAHDDHGIASAEWVVFDESQKDADGNPRVLESKQIPLGDQRLQQHLMGKFRLDLRQFDLTAGSQISYAIRVTDNREVQLSEDGSAPPNSTLARQGTADEPGTEGAKGAEGAEGTVGTEGTEGTEEAVGTEGTEGTEGTKGTEGAEGTEGTKGTKGTKGTEGTEGTEGTKGTEGAEGTEEAVGAEETEGAEGTEGTEGAREGEGTESRNGMPDERLLASDEIQAASQVSPPQDPTAINSEERSQQATATAEGDVEPEMARDQSAADGSGTGDVKKTANSDNPVGQPGSSSPPDRYVLTSQQSRQGQNTLTNRRRLKITEKLSAISAAEDRPGEELEIRENVVEIDRMLAEIESGLRLLVDGKIADSDRAEQFRRLDQGLGNVESYVADLREQTRENQYAFVGLQMVDITRTHVTPARDRVFSATQRPVASEADAAAALQHIVRARESLAALLKRYDRVKRERKLERSLDESVKMYEVYVQKRRMLLRETRQNLNPLERKMGIIEVNQDYLDRFAEVQTLRREMIEEFAEMLGDDPRLLSRYLELVKRRGRSLRDQLTEISERQYEATEEGLSWLQIDDAQKPELWSIIVELRLHSAQDLAQDAAQLAERIEKQMPLSLKKDVGTPAAVIKQAQAIAGQTRTISFDAQRIADQAGQITDQSLLIGRARSLLNHFDLLFALLDQLQFENDGNDTVADYLEPRLLETRVVADQADAWTILSESLVGQSYAALVHPEQHRLAVTTQLLRVEMLGMESDLEGQFRRLLDSDVPGEIKDMIRRLHQLMETITFNQAAAAYRAAQGELESMVAQQQLATTRLEQAEELFDQIRRAVVTKLDEYDPPDPEIADLRDPTLDEFLARLEREPNITTQLGIPTRRTNLRVRSDSVFSQEGNNGGALGGSSDAAAERVRQAMKMQRKKQDGPQQTAKADAKEQEEMRKQAKRAQEMLEQSLLKIRQQRDDPETSPQQRARLEKMAQEMEKMLEQSNGDDADRRAWQQIVQSDQASALIEALAQGDAVPDEQWNRLLSTLEDGLWQVRGKQPPEAYRKAIHQYQDQIRELMQTIDEG